MQVTMLISREPVEETVDIEVEVEVEVDAYGVRPAAFATDRHHNTWMLTELEQDCAAEIAREEAAE